MAKEEWGMEVGKTTNQYQPVSFTMQVKAAVYFIHSAFMRYMGVPCPGMGEGHVKEEEREEEEEVLQHSEITVCTSADN